MSMIRTPNGTPGYWEQIPGWFDWWDLYDEVAMTTPPGSSVVEVGVCFGKSLFYLCQKIKESGKDIRVVAVDRWEPYTEHGFIYDPAIAANDGERTAAAHAQMHGGTFPAFLYNLYHSPYKNMVDVVRMDSVQAARSYITPAPPYPNGRHPHFVFIDANHEQDAVTQDVTSWWIFARPEWMAGHDCNRDDENNFPGVWRAVDSVFGRPNWSWELSTCWVVRRSELERPDRLDRSRE